MSIEYVFDRFCEILSADVDKQEILKEWNKNSFCFHVLASGERRGKMCEKRCVRDTFYCKAHEANVVKTAKREEKESEDEKVEPASEDEQEQPASEDEQEEDNTIDTSGDEREIERGDEHAEHTELVEEEQVKSDL